MKVSVIIPTLNAGNTLAASLHALVDGAVDGIISEVIIADGGSTDDTLSIAPEFGATIIQAPQGRGHQMSAGARAARGDWFLFLHADTRLGAGWIGDVRSLIFQEQNRVGVFTLSFDEKGVGPALVAWGAMVRARAFRLPYGDQGLLISRRRYDEIGGFRDMALFEDVDMIRRLRKLGGRRSIHILPSPAITSARRYRQEGYIKRVLRNLRCLVMYHRGRSIAEIQAFYEARTKQ